MLPDDAKFCGECGSNQANVYAAVEAEIVDVVIEAPRRYDSPAADAREVRERLIGEKAEYYLEKFDSMETLRSFTSWNWCAFLFGISWMVYRKMYAFGIALWVLNNVLSLLGLGALSLIVWVGMGVVGNYLYMKDIDNRTEKAMNMQPEERELYIQKWSGTSWVGVAVMIAANMILNLMLA